MGWSTGVERDGEDRRVTLTVTTAATIQTSLPSGSSGSWEGVRTPSVELAAARRGR